MMKGDVKVSADLGHIDQMALGVDEEPSGARRDFLCCNPGGRHAAYFLGIEIIGVLMRPSHRVAVEIHALHELAGLSEDRPDGSLRRA
jgi:hypothetical protein